jgi:hypothetical protein
VHSHRCCSFYDIKWVEVDVAVINNTLLDYTGRTRKLPKALKEWDACVNPLRFPLFFFYLRALFDPLASSPAL